jgi:hypothetical protein
VVCLGRPPSPLDHQLARSVVVRPPDKHAIARVGGCHPTTASPDVVEWSLYLDQPEGSPAAVWSWLKWEKPPCLVSLGRGGRFSLPRWELWGLDGACRHGPLQEWWLTAGGACDNGA